MKLNFDRCILAVAIAQFVTCAAVGGPVTISMRLDQPGVAVSPTMHGLFFEDINYAADGGLYAELVQNRSFEHHVNLWGWLPLVKVGAAGSISVETEAPLNANNEHFLRINVTNAGSNGWGVVNSGFDGIALGQGDRYRFSIYARRRAGDDANLRVLLKNSSGRVFAEGSIKGIGLEWKQHELLLKSSAFEPTAQLVVLVTSAGVVDIDMVSLFPENTFKGRRNGLRADLAQMLADAKPGFLRFPGGCIVEGRDFANMYRWKDTIGDVAQRKQNWDLWQNGESPQYHQTYGLGFFEYFQLCEDIGAEPVPVVNCGMCCQARRGPYVPLDQLGPYVQDALDLIEFANGDSSSEWGARRAAMGHPKPFKLKFLGVGNEQWMQDYFDRYTVFYKAIKAKYPSIQLITTAGPHPDDVNWRFAWDKFKSGTPADIVDEHYYRPPHWFFQNDARYDSYDRKGPKVFAGEYAAHDVGRRNNLRAALAEAAHITSLWRNADVVQMSCYAPLFAKVGHVQWRPDLIWFDNMHVCGSPSYYVQAMAGGNRPDISLPVTVSGAATIDAPPFAGRVGIGTWKTQAEFKDVVVTKGDQVLFKSDFTENLSGWDILGGKWTVVNGAARQTSDDENVRAFAGDPSWTDYTLSMKARKIGGAEGFFISFGSPDAATANVWNIAGWDNTQHGLEVPGASEPYVRGRVESNRWYDIRIELQGANAKCYLDGKLVQQAINQPTRAIYAAGGRDLKRGEVVLAVVNVGAAQQGRVELAGGLTTKSSGKALILTSAKVTDENSFEEPKRVIPREESFSVGTSPFEYTFPEHSFTILRIPAR